MAEKKKKAKPIPFTAAIVLVLVAFAVMGSFLVYMFSSGGEGDSSGDVSIEQSFGSESSLEPPPDQVQVKDTMADANVGDAVVFGKYEQNGNTADGAEALEWIVLEKQEDKLVLISRYCIEALPYNQARTGTEWSNSTLSQWLNSEFLSNTFTENEYNSIISDTDGSRVTMLSSEEALKYYEYDSWRAAAATEYAASKGARVENGYCFWWLTDSGKTDNSAYYVYFDGTVQDKGFAVDYGNVGVRPVIQVLPTAETEDIGTEISE